MKLTLFDVLSTAAHSVFCSRRVLLMPVKTASWRRRSEPLYRKLTMSPRMSPKPPTPPDQRTSQMPSPSLTARDRSLLTGQTVKHQHPTKRKVLPVNTHQPLQPLRPSSVFIQIVLLLPTESLRTKKTITVTRKRRAKRTIWSRRPQVLVTLSPLQILEGTTAPHKLKVPEPPR